MSWPRGGAALLASIAAAMPAKAGPLLITPTTIELGADRLTAAIEIVNQGDGQTDVQFRAYEWEQSSGDNALRPTTKMIVSPPIATLQGHGKQVFRLLMLDATPATSERSFRLKLNELPQASTGAVAINVEFSLPVFVTPEDARPKLDWRRSSDGNGIVISNSGNRRIRLESLEIADASGAVRSLPLRSASYVLAGAKVSFPWPKDVLLTSGTRLSARGDVGVVDVPAQASTAP